MSGAYRHIGESEKEIPERKEKGVHKNKQERNPDSARNFAFMWFRL